MRTAFDPALELDARHRLVLLSTGADAVSEHARGITPLMNHLGAAPALAEQARNLCVQALRAGQEPCYPRLLDELRIRNGQELHFQAFGNEEAVMWATCGSHGRLFGPELLTCEKLGYTRDLRSLRDLHKKHDVAAMWDREGMAIRVRTPRYVRALQGLHQAAQEGKVLFGGRFFTPKQDDRFYGILLVNEELLTDEDLHKVSQEQQTYEKALRLRARSRREELVEQLRKRMGEAFAEQLLDVRAHWVDASDESRGACYQVLPKAAGVLAGWKASEALSYEQALERAQALTGVAQMS